MLTPFYKIEAFFLALFMFFGINLTGGEKYDTYSLRYGEKSSNKMDIFVPESAYDNEYNGIILNLHGGSWVSGSKEERTKELRRIVGNGYILATMNYSLYKGGSSVSGYTMLDEITQALNEIQRFSEEKNLNITKVCMMGYSAGAHLAAWYAYSRPQESPIEIVLAAYRVAPCDFSPKAWGGSGYEIASLLAGQNITDEMKKDGRAEEIVKAVSPVYYINENSLPTVCAYGGADLVVPAGNASSMKKALEESGIDYTYVMFPNSGHMLESDSDCTAQYNRALYAYLKTYFGY